MRAPLLFVAAALAAATVGAAVTTVPAVAAAESESAAITGTWFDGLEGGLCFDDALDDEDGFDFAVPAFVVPCDSPHDNEIVARVPLGDDDYPADDVEALVDELCAPEYAAFLGKPLGDTVLTPFSIWPDESDWAAGSRDVICAVYAREKLVGTAASAALRAPGKTIATMGETDGTRKILLVNAGTGSFEALTDSELSALPAPPAWSPDGISVAFAAEAGGGASEIYIAAVDGGKTTVVVQGPGTNDGAAFSPDGATMAYISDAEGGEYEIYALDLEGGASARLTTYPDRDTTPNWSPDGSRVAFRRRTDGVSDIWIMNADGSDPQRLTDNGGNNFDPRWSPDGSRLLFTTDVPGNYDIWVMKADGSDPQAVTTHPAEDEYPTWSPDGELIAFHSSRHGGVSLWLMRADGSEQSELTGFGPIGYPAFAPAEVD